MYQIFETCTYPLPFIPRFVAHRIYKSHVRVTWFERNFSQAWYKFEENEYGSNACIFIAILLASKCCSRNIKMFGVTRKVSHCLIRALGESMLEGNYIYEQLLMRGQLPNINLTLPEGIRCSGLNKCGLTEWKTTLHMFPLIDTLCQNLKTEWNEWLCTPNGKKYRTLYAVLIYDLMSVLIIMQRGPCKQMDTVTFVDSHQHSDIHGAVIAVAARSRLKPLCRSFCDIISFCYHSQPDTYELSFLYFEQKNSETERCLALEGETSQAN